MFNNTLKKYHIPKLMKPNNNFESHFIHFEAHNNQVQYHIPKLMKSNNNFEAHNNKAITFYSF
jgi:hypothetical protein